MVVRGAGGRRSAAGRQQQRVREGGGGVRVEGKCGACARRRGTRAQAAGGAAGGAGWGRAGKAAGTPRGRAPRSGMAARARGPGERRARERPPLLRYRSPPRARSTSTSSLRGTSDAHRRTRRASAVLSSPTGTATPCTAITGGASAKALQQMRAGQHGRTGRRPSTTSTSTEPSARRPRFGGERRPGDPPMFRPRARALTMPALIGNGAITVLKAAAYMLRGWWCVAAKECGSARGGRAAPVYEWRTNSVVRACAWRAMGMAGAKNIHF